MECSSDVGQLVSGRPGRCRPCSQRRHSRQNRRFEAKAEAGAALLHCVLATQDRIFKKFSVNSASVP